MPIPQYRITGAELARTLRKDPTADVTELRSRLRAERLEEHIRKELSAAPPLTQAQKDAIAALLRPSAAKRGKSAHDSGRVSA